jgi:uncharacterized membrane protein YqiK
MSKAAAETKAITEAKAEAEAKLEEAEAKAAGAAEKASTEKDAADAKVAILWNVGRCLCVCTVVHRELESDMLETQPRNISKSKVETDLLDFANQPSLCASSIESPVLFSNEMQADLLA